MPTVTANGAELHYEIRGARAARPADHGSDGGGGHFDALADLLADDS
jgi:hypothetical protein